MEESQPEPERPEEIQGRTQRLHGKLIDARKRETARWCKQRQSERANDPRDAVDPDRTHRIVDLETVLQHLDAIKRGSAAQKTDGHGS